MKSWKEQYLDEIEELIKVGAIHAYHENVMMCYEHTDFKSKMTEYLVVVNIAKKLLNWALPKHLQIHLEYSLADFYNGAFPSIKWTGTSNLDSKIILRNEHNPINNKSARIDIVITSEPNNEGYYIRPNYKSLIGIEVKSISKQNKTILEDIHRLSQSLILTDSISGNNIEACYSLFYRRLDNYRKVNSKKELTNKKEKEIKKWKIALESFELQYPTLNYIFKPILVQESDIEDTIQQFPPEHFDYSEVAEKSGLIMCYLVKITKKKS